MKNIFSADEPTPEVDPAFHNQPQAGPGPTAPSCYPTLPPASELAPLPEAIERIAEIAAPGSASKADPITGR